MVVLVSMLQEVHSCILGEYQVVMHVCLHHIFNCLWILIEELSSVHFTSVVNDDANSLLFKNWLDLIWSRLGEI